MRKFAFTLVLTAAGLAASGGCASAQGARGTTLPVGQNGSTPAAAAYGYTGFGIRFGATMTPGRPVTPEFPVVGVVHPGSPAHQAGIAVGDVVLEINGRDTREDGALRVSPGVRYTYRIRRGREEREISLVAVTPPVRGERRRP